MYCRDPYLLNPDYTVSADSPATHKHQNICISKLLSAEICYQWGVLTNTCRCAPFWQCWAHRRPLCVKFVPNIFRSQQLVRSEQSREKCPFFTSDHRNKNQIQNSGKHELMNTFFWTHSCTTWRLDCLANDGGVPLPFWNLFLCFSSLVLQCLYNK